MRKYHQKMILELLKTLEEAADNLKKLFSKKDLQNITNLLADCQETALQIGQFIEQLEGGQEQEQSTQEPLKTVALLEEYCELLYHANEELNKPDSSAGPIKKLQKQIIKIEESVKNDLKPDRIEVVFFPYKASMWDSLESIWRAAKDDPACDAYVVPVPYYEVGEKYRDGDPLGKMHYEGDKYPDNVAVVDWQNYNIEERRPDVIFTHYPYDDNVSNYTINPQFYSKRLKQYCEQLIHVPYFVTQGSVPDYNASLPGVIHAHRVIAQSEAVRQSYIEHYKKFDKEQGWKGCFGKAEEKFIALGSPKFDKVINARREDYTLPPEWERLISKPDGSKKKVILYNTHMWKWLEGGETYFKKLRFVFDSFRNNEDVVLWWRPHPSTELNFKIKRPHLLGAYYKVVNDYKSEGWGIYDDTPDLHRAIACTDAYYGDGSSLVALYGVTGKPVVYQNIEETENDALLRFADFAIDEDGAAWGFDLFTDGLFRLDFMENRASFVVRSGCVPEYKSKKVQSHRYIGIRCVGDEVFCFPCFLDNIMVHNRVSGETVKIPLNNDYLLPSDWNGFALRFTVEYQGKIYSFGSWSKAIVVFDISNHSVQYDTTLFDRVGLLTDAKTHIKYPLYISECSEDGKITLLMRNCEHFIRYTLQTQEVEFVAMNPALRHCLQADFDGKYFWLIAEKNKKIIKWNPDSDEMTDYYMSADGFSFSDDDRVFTGISDCGSFLLLFPMLGNKLLKFDKKMKRFSEYMEIPVPVDLNDSIFKYCTPKHAEDKIYAFSRYNGTIYELDKLSGKVMAHKFCLDKKDYKSYYNVYFDFIDNAITESGFGNIANFFANSISDGQEINYELRDNFLNCSAAPDGSCGIKTYEQVKKDVLK